MITPRKLRDGLSRGAWTCIVKTMPEPSPDWNQSRQRRMRVAIRAAKLFLIHHNAYAEIRSRLYEDRLIAKGVSDQRIGQYITKGTRFLMERGVFEPTSPTVGQKEK